MPASDMCDVIHYFFEVDNLGEENWLDAKVSMRRNIYRKLYDRPYTWKDGVSGSGSSSEYGTQEVGGDSSLRYEHKSYIPPTPFNPDAPNPFGAVLDAPLE
jgi:hypothetical protein